MLKRDDGSPHQGIATRQYADDVDLPVSRHLRVRFARAVTRALVKPLGAPVLRTVVTILTQELRAQGFTDDQIRLRLAELVQTIALGRGFGENSLVSGKPRWQHLSDRIVEWVTIDGHESDAG